MEGDGIYRTTESHRFLQLIMSVEKNLYLKRTSIKSRVVPQKDSDKISDLFPLYWCTFFWSKTS